MLFEADQQDAWQMMIPLLPILGFCFKADSQSLGSHFFFLGIARFTLLATSGQSTLLSYKCMPSSSSARPCMRCYKSFPDFQGLHPGIERVASGFHPRTSQLESHCPSHEGSVPSQPLHLFPWASHTFPARSPAVPPAWHCQWPSQDWSEQTLNLILSWIWRPYSL